MIQIFEYRFITRAVFTNKNWFSKHETLLSKQKTKKRAVGDAVVFGHSVTCLLILL